MARVVRRPRAFPRRSPRPVRRWGRLARRLALAAALVLAAVALLYAAASWYLASQVTKAERTNSDATPATLGMAYEDVTFPSRDGAVTLKGWYVPVEAQTGVVVVVHGLDSHKASDGVGTLELARRLRGRGLGVLLFDLRGHGHSGEGKLSGGLFEQQDLLGAFDWLVERGVPPERIGVLGFSLGGAVALLAAAQEPRIRAVATDSTFADLRDLVAGEVPKRTSAPQWLVPALVPGMVAAARLAYGIDLGAVVPEEAVARLDYPLLLMHSRADTRIPAQHTLRLKAAARHPATELWLVDGVEHARLFKGYADEYVERVAAYFQARFQAAARPPALEDARRLALAP